MASPAVRPPELARYEALGFQLIFSLPASATIPTRRMKNHTLGGQVSVVVGQELSLDHCLAVIEFSWPGGVRMARRLLPGTSFGFGRGKHLITQAWYTTPVPILSRDYTDDTGVCIVQLRGVGPNGQPQDPIPIAPSTDPSGDTITLRDSGDIGHTFILERRAVIYAIACLLLHHLGPRGLIQTTRRPVSAVLLAEGLTTAEVVDIGEALAHASGQATADVRATVETTALALRIDKSIAHTKFGQTAGPVSASICTTIREWLGRSWFLENGRGAILATSQENIRRALQRLGVRFRWDTFSDIPMITTGNAIECPATDDMTHALWLQIQQEFGFEPSPQLFRSVTLAIAHAHPTHPVREYLGRVTWDGVPRIHRWLSYLGGAPSTEYTRACSELLLMSAARRMLEPGCVCSEMVVLTSDAAWDKSPILQALCPIASWYGIDIPVGTTPQVTARRTTGRWILEYPGLHMAPWQAIRNLHQMLVIQVDGRSPHSTHLAATTARPRQFVVVGTVPQRLPRAVVQAHPGIWPVLLHGAFNVDKLRFVRDQLWAEAVLRCRDRDLRMPPELVCKALAHC